MTETIYQIYDSLSPVIWTLVFQTLLVVFTGSSLVVLTTSTPRMFLLRYRRIMVGLSLLFALHLAILGFVLLQQVGILDFPSLPILVRGITLVSLIILFWLWCYPDKSDRADLFCAIICMLVLILIVLGIFWLPSIGLSVSLTLLLLDLIGGISAFILLVTGIGILLIQKPDLWGYGIFSFFVLIAGLVLHTAALTKIYPFSAAVYITQIAVYPLLLLLPQRITITKKQKEPEMSEKEQKDLLRHIEQQQAILDRRPSFTDPKILQSIIEIIEENEPDAICRQIVITVARIMRADICLLLYPPDGNGLFHLACGYDIFNEKFIEEISLKAQELPGLTSAMNRGEILSFEDKVESQELEIIARQLSIEKTAHVMFASVLSSDGEPISGMLLLSPFTNREWTQGDEYYFNILAKFLVYFMQQNQEMVNLNTQLVESRRMELEARELYEEARIEHQLFIDQVSSFQKETDMTERSKFSSLVESQTEYTDVQEALKFQDDEDESVDISRRWVPEFDTDEVERLKSELQMALQEISILRNELEKGKNAN